LQQDRDSEDSFLTKVTKKVRELVPYSITFLNEKRRPNFKKEYQEDWTRVEESLIIAMLYHSNSIDETKRFFGL
jgi:hypothetical protein